MAPTLWGTTDGVIPYRRFWVEYQGLLGSLALERMNLASAISMALGGEAADPLRRQARDDAFPVVQET